jgi:hypothetical protein
MVRASLKLETNEPRNLLLPLNKYSKADQPNIDVEAGITAEIL